VQEISTQKQKGGQEKFKNFLTHCIREQRRGRGKAKLCEKAKVEVQDLLVAVVLAGQVLERGLDDATAQAEHQVESRLLLDVVVSERAAVLELLACVRLSA
jgi:hypothetical protein